MADADHPRAFRSHTLVQERPGIYVFKPILRLRLVPLLALVPGLVIFVLASLVALERPGALLFVVIGAVFVWAGLWARGPALRFDLNAGQFVRGYVWRRVTTPLSAVAAVELVPAGRYVPEDSDPYETFQLNAVLAGGAPRVNLTNHADREASAADGRALAAALGVGFQEHGRPKRDADRSPS